MTNQLTVNQFNYIKELLEMRVEVLEEYNKDTECLRELDEVRPILELVRSMEVK